MNQPMHITDEILAQRIIKGDKQALYVFYERYKTKLHTFISIKVSKQQDQEELLQDTYLAFIEALRDFHGQSSIKTFLYAICRHKIIDYYRRKKIRHLVFSQLPQLEGLISPLLQPDEQLDKKEISEKIQLAFSLMSPLYRRILRYKYIEGRSVEEIAQLCSITFKSAESKLFRARKSFVLVYSSLPE